MKLKESENGMNAPIPQIRPMRKRRKDGSALQFKAFNEQAFYRSDLYASDDGNYSVLIRDAFSIVSLLVFGGIAFGLVTFLFLSDRWFFGIGHIIFLVLMWGSLAWVTMSDAVTLWKHPKMDGDE